MRIPTIIYGTAWKEERTQELVGTALRSGYRAIDTANQRKHYYEESVGKAIAQSGIPRAELFLQTKFTYAAGQDSRLPYDKAADIKTQVRQSLRSSLEHLGTTYVDSYLLHGPSSCPYLSDIDLEVWEQFERSYAEKTVLAIGVSNVTVDQLRALCQKSKIKPAFVQNRCYAKQGWDHDVRIFCKNHGILYQGFSLLTANAFIIPHLESLSQKYHKTAALIIFRFAQQISIFPLTGTTNHKHMQQDLQLDFEIEKEDVRFIENIALHVL